MMKVSATSLKKCIECEDKIILFCLGRRNETAFNVQFNA